MPGTTKPVVNRAGTSACVFRCWNLLPRASPHGPSVLAALPQGAVHRRKDEKTSGKEEVSMSWKRRSSYGIHRRPDLGPPGGAGGVQRRWRRWASGAGGKVLRQPQRDWRERGCPGQ